MSPQASSTLPVGSASADSWDEVIDTRAGVPITELIDGLDDIAAVAIPSARLPRRAYNVFSAQFASWSDIAGQTVSALLSRPKAGEGSVRALLTAAADGTVTLFEICSGAVDCGAMAMDQRWGVGIFRRQRRAR